MTRDWARLGAAIREGYRSVGLTHTEFATAAGISRSTLYRLEQGTGPAPSEATLGKLERALGWPAGRAAAVAEGEDAPPSEVAMPIRVSVSRPAPLNDPSVLDQLPTQISEELYGAGEVLGVDVVDLGPDGSGARMIVVVRRDQGAADPDPEVLKATLAAWQRKRRELWKQEVSPPD